MSGPGGNEVGRVLGLTLALAACCLSGCPRADLTRPDLQQTVFALELPRVGGGSFSLGTCQGKVMMLDFFVTWSQASMLAIPSYRLLKRRLASRGLCLVGIALDELGAQVVEPFVQGLEIDYPVLLADEDLRVGRSVFGELPAVPTLMIFDRHGELVQVWLGFVHPERIEPVLDRLLP